ncbi:MAG: hypothetical protein OEZ65_14015 [Gemmatimonadota bacterium]|nr:hypothetical protein [Gemmatimonadota bacterium]MDH5760700.1 hypothetical protein [Gemmatimonadota bacterium]
METRTAYCSACDRPVNVVVRKEARSWPSPEQADPEAIVCLEYGETCTGALCPLFALPTEQMEKNLDEYHRAAAEGRTEEDEH